MAEYTIHGCLAGYANSRIAERILQEAGMEASFHENLDDLLEEASHGVGIILLEEACLQAGYWRFVDFFKHQPRWSEIPVIMFTQNPSSAISNILLEENLYMTILEKPIARVALESHIAAALRARKRQYDLRDLLKKLSDLNENLEREVAFRTFENEQRRNEAERTVEDLRHFASVVSHDLREPLLAISRYLSLLRSRYSGHLDDDGRKFINQTMENAHRMQSMISSILKYSRSELEILNPEPVDVADVISIACENLAVAIDKSGAEVHHGELGFVRADRMQLVQLFQNLISNAIKFSHLEPPRIHISVETLEGEHQFCVEDNGIGIDFEKAKNIFRIFDRADSNSRFPGSGIGLAVCKKIVERHGGIIWVESQPWKGAAFYFTLPQYE